MLKGITYCVGVGCGDPELMTLKALRVIRENRVIAVVGENYQNALAYKIALQNVPQLPQKEILALPMPMTKQTDVIRKYQQQNTCRIESYLDKGENVVALTLGDPSVYSSLHYLRKMLLEHNYPVQTISGVTSFCEVANTLNIPLSQWDGEIHILPALYQKSFTDFPKGTLVLMKASENVALLKQYIRANGLSAWAVEHCGMEKQKIHYGVDNIPDKLPYFTIIIVQSEAPFLNPTNLPKD